MWRRRRDSAQAAPGRPDTVAPGAPPRRGRWGVRRAWRMDRRSPARVPLSPPPEFARSGVGAGVAPVAVASPMSGRPGEPMPSVYCTGCGEANPEGARFCSQCGTPILRGQGGDRLTDTTSTISIAGTELAEEFGDDSDADAAALDALPAGTALLVVRRGPNAGSRFLLDSDLTLVGRHPDSDIFLDDVTVSRRHAEFYRQGGRFTVRDVGSLNGTYVNRERIEDAELGGGDEVQIGKFRLVFLIGPRSQADYSGGSQVGG
jgi:FHA domain-containing protein/zinc ribbon protein